ncbi:MAG: hypothetical protein KAU20_07870 [Nanoarchaeota archaeon]|nr:hypothetical protein [Nanoarchaeota archaeon]
MEIIITTDKDSVEFNISRGKETSNDEITRAVAYLEIIKQDLLQELKHDYEVFEEDD